METYKYRSDEGVRYILAQAARKWIYFVSMDAPIRVRKLPVSEARFMKPFPIKPKQAAKAFRKAGKSLGITSGAKKFLKGV